jgi:ubiquinone/menaquinone biosynthesis C-methylase UbiE
VHWSTFWNDGWITTFGGSKPKNYDGVVREFWREKFLELPRGSRILDIAAGNGAIATIAAQTSDERDKGFFVAATDLAEIHAELVGDEDTKQARKQIEFHSFTPCEKQPFDDDSFNLVTSQFGFEYSNIGETLREVRRLLLPGCRFIAISHHADSVLIKTADMERKIYTHALDGLDLFDASRRYFEALGELTGDAQELKNAMENAKPLSREVNDKMDEFRQKHGDDERSRYIVGAISYVAQTAKATTLDQRLAALDQAQLDCQLHRARLYDMVTAALDQQKIEELSITAREVGFQSVHCLDLYGDDKALAGWQIHLR